MSREFDRYMLHHGAGTEEKFATLTDSEFRAHIVGVLALAATSPLRGYLFVGEIEAQPIHVARKAGVTERVAKSAIRKLREVGVLVRDEEVGGWRVHNWDVHQSERRDPTAAKRAREYRDRRSSRDASRDDHSAVTCPERSESRSPSREARGLPKVLEVEKEEQRLPQPLASEGGQQSSSLSKKKADRARNGSKRRTDLQALAAEEQAQAAGRLSAPVSGDGETWERLAGALRGAVPESAWAQWFEPISVVARDGDTLLVRGPAGGLEQHDRVIRQAGERFGVSVRLATAEEAAAAANLSMEGSAA